MTVSRIPQLVERTAMRMPDRVALQDRLGGRRVTYRELWTRARGGAAVLRDHGLGPGARVLLPMDGSPDWTIALLSILEACGGSPAGITTYGALKQAVTDAVVATLDPIQKRYADLAADPVHVTQVFTSGAARCREVTAPVLAAAQAAIGL